MHHGSIGKVLDIVDNEAIVAKNRGKEGEKRGEK